MGLDDQPISASHLLPLHGSHSALATPDSLVFLKHTRHFCLRAFVLAICSVLYTLLSKKPHGSFSHFL